MSKHSFKMIDESFYDRVVAEKGAFLVVGHNYGQGSSREQAAIIPRYLGINVIIAKGFARLHLANMVNWGILPLVFKNEKDYESIKQGDVLDVDCADLKEGNDVKVTNKTQGEVYYLSTPLFQPELNAIKEGGYVNVLKAKNQ